jgi:hypothetical protein
MATTTPNYGWPVPTSTDFVKDGAQAIEDLGDAIDATVFGLPSSALSLVKTQTIGTTVASVAVTDAFSTTYDAYQIIISGGVASTSGNLNLQLGATTTGYYSARIAAVYSSSVVQVGTNNNGASFTLGAANTGTIALNVFITDPFLTENTKIQGGFIAPNTTLSAGAVAGFLNNATSYTDFTLTPASGTLTGGTIYVYGYVK